MKTTIAILSACLFAGAAFAQTAPAQAPAQTTTPDSSTSPEVAKAAAGHEKQGTKADAKDAKAGAKPAKKAKKAKGKSNRKARPDDGHASKEDTTA
jgi:hypothetical protein